MQPTTLLGSSATSAAVGAADVFTTRARRTTSATRDTSLGRAGLRLWIVQAVLALVFLFAGVMKLIMPLQLLAAQSHLPGLFLRFIAVAEILGALGLILPGLLRIRPELTPLAAAGLVIIMIGATTVTLASGMIAPALVPAAVGVLAGFVAWGRGRRLLAVRRRSSERGNARRVVRD